MSAGEAVVLAGGRGSRLRPLTDDVPKPLLPLAGVPFLHGLLARLAGAGVARVHVMVGADPGPFAGLPAVAAQVGVAAEIHPEPEPLDTAGGVRGLLGELAGPVLVCNGDVLTDLDLAHLVARHRATAAVATLALTRVADPSTFGVCVLEGERLVRFIEKPPPGTPAVPDTVNAGTYVLEPGALGSFPGGPLSFERDVFPGLLDAGSRLTGVVSAARWADLGTPERLLHGQRLVLTGEVEWPSVTSVTDRGGGIRLESDVSVDPSARLVGPVLLRRGTSVGPNAVVGPHVATSPGVVVAAGASVAEAAIGARTRIGAGAQVAATITGEDVAIGAGARLEGPVAIARGVTVDDGERLGPGSRRPAR